ncbi:MAG: tail fiber protein, partial [Fusobacteriaceae bacterium]
KATTPYVTDFLRKKAEGIQVELDALESEFLIHTHQFDKIIIDNNRDVGTTDKIGLSKLFGTRVIELTNNAKHGAPTLELYNSDLKNIEDSILENAIEIERLEAEKAPKVHDHDASDIKTGVLPISVGGTGATDFTKKYIVNKSTYLSSVDQIPFEDIIMPGGGIAPLVHKHSWLDLYEETIPYAHERPGEPGLVILSDDPDNNNNYTTLSSMAIQNLVNRFNSDSASKDHLHDDIYRRLDVKIRWSDILKWTVDIAQIGDGEDYRGIVSLSNDIRLDRDDIAATSSAVKQLYDMINNVGGDFASKVHFHDATDVTSGILSVERGGTGSNLMGLPSGFLKYNHDTMSTDLRDVISLGEIHSDIYDTFAPIVHQHEWVDILNVPKASLGTPGIVQISDMLDSTGNSSDIATSLTLAKKMQSQIDSMSFDGYTKAETDEKFLGKKEGLGWINFDNIIEAGVYPNEAPSDVMNQTNSPTLHTGILTVFRSLTFVTQLYTSSEEEMFSRTFRVGTTNTPWLQVATGGDIELATYSKAGIFKINDGALADEMDTVPTSNIVFEEIEALKINVSGSYVDKRGDAMSGSLRVPAIIVGEEVMGESGPPYRTVKCAMFTTIDPGTLLTSVNFDFSLWTNEIHVSKPEPSVLAVSGTVNHTKKVRRRDIWL